MGCGQINMTKKKTWGGQGEELQGCSFQILKKAIKIAARSGPGDGLNEDEERRLTEVKGYSAQGHASGEWWIKDMSGSKFGMFPKLQGTLQNHPPVGTCQRIRQRDGLPTGRHRLGPHLLSSAWHGVNI